MERVYSDREVDLVRMGMTLALVTKAGRRVVKQFHVLRTMREDVRRFVRMRNLTVANAGALDWDPNR